MGYVVQHLCIQPDPNKVDMLTRAKQPETIQDLQSFLGLLQFYKGMLPHLAHTAHPLYAATTANLPFQWTVKLNNAFLAAKSMLMKDVMQSELVGADKIDVLVDASLYAACVILRQDGKIIFCASKVLNAAQRNWSTYRERALCCSMGHKKTEKLHIWSEVHTLNGPQTSYWIIK
jgi:hypothetical protein